MGMWQGAGGPGPGSPGDARLARMPRSERRALGVFYTPRAVADHVTELVLGRCTGPLERLRVCDPAAGGGSFLLAAARYLADNGVAPRHVATRQLWGIDLDPVAMELAGDELARWAELDVSDERVLRSHLVCCDALGELPPTWIPGDDAEAGFDVVLGNPPFQGQLRIGTGRTASTAARLRQRFGDLIGPYTDTSAIFLLVASQLVKPGGVVGMILPHSTLVAGHASRIRSHVLTGMTLEHLWWSDELVFDAAVRVCAPVLRRNDMCAGRVGGSVTRSVGTARRCAPELRVDPEALAAAPTWGVLASDLLGIPRVSLGGAGTLGDWCDATAGFRDQFYGLVPHVIDAHEVRDEAHSPRLVTCGLIDPGVSHWGTRPARFAGTRWQAPRVDMDALGASDASLHRWVTDRLHPKVVVATQTRILEAAVDVHGCWVPSTPTIAVTPRDPARLWGAAAVLMSPVASAWVLGRNVGAALGADHLKLSARDVLAIPLPPDEETLGAAASVMADVVQADPDGVRAALLEAGRLTCAAYGVDEGVWSWWAERLPPRGARSRVDRIT